MVLLVETFEFRSGWEKVIVFSNELIESGFNVAK